VCKEARLVNSEIQKLIDHAKPQITANKPFMEWANSLMTESNLFKKEHFKKLKQMIQDKTYDGSATKNELRKAMCRLSDEFKEEFVDEILKENDRIRGEDEPI
jgi:Ca2+-binding EF-hand superfamily protein